MRSLPTLLFLPSHSWCRLAAAMAGSGMAISMAAAAEEKVNFQDHVRPIFEAACNNCHNPDKKKGGLDLTSYAALMAGGSSGEIAVSGDPGGSRLYASVTKAAEPFMPPQGDGLATPQLDILKRWIEGGLLDTAGGTVRKAKKPAFSAQLADVTLGKPDGPPPMPENLLLEPVVTTPRAAATAALAASPWAPLVALSGQRQVLFYNTDTLELAGVLPCPDGAVESLQFSRNGRLVVAGVGIGGKSGKVIAWEVTTGKLAFEVGDERDTVLGADLSADHAVVALGGPSRRVKLYATADGGLIKDLKKHTDWVTAVQFSPDGVLLATGDRAGGLQVWEGRSGNEYFTLPGHTGAITAVSWRADGNILASASEDGTVRLWEMNEGKEVKKWNAHGAGVQSMGFTHDGRLVSCGRDQHVKVWNQDGGQTAAQNKFSDLTLAACFSHDGGRFIVGDWSGRISVWNTADAAALGDMSAAPPSIDQRLANLIPQRDQARDTVAAAAAALTALMAKETAARQAMESARLTVESFQQKADSVMASLAAARAAAEALAVRLAVPAPESSAPESATATAELDPAATQTAAAEAVDFQTHLAAARATLAPMSTLITDRARAFTDSVPSQITAARQLATAKQSEVVEAEKQSAQAAAAHEAAVATLQQHERSIARWEAAKINTLIFQKKGALFTATTQLEEVTTTLASLEGQAEGQTDQLAALRKQKADLETEAAALQQSIEAESARYLSALPK
ncbi:MAG: c-type cytochrome domain-containing protein [Verrucomicrobiales bacterium]